jgi:hypothetical protein
MVCILIGSMWEKRVSHERAQVESDPPPARASCFTFPKSDRDLVDRVRRYQIAIGKARLFEKGQKKHGTVSHESRAIFRIAKSGTLW